MDLQCLLFFSLMSDAPQHIQMIDVYIGNSMADKTSDSLEYDHNNPLPYGDIPDIHGNILKAITKEEHDEMLARVRRAFRSKR